MHRNCHATTASSRQLAFFGHGLGALLAFEVVRELRRHGAAPPLHLLVSSRRGPLKVVADITHELATNGLTLVGARA